MLTDHKPLLMILGPKTGVPTLAAARMQRWSFILETWQHGNADALSRLELGDCRGPTPNPVYRVKMVKQYVFFGVSGW